MIRGVVLDVDDTVYLERDYVRSGFEAVGSWADTSLGVSGVSAVAWRLFESGVRGRTLTNALAQQGVEVTPSVRDEAIAVYRSHRPRIEPLPDTRIFLDRLRRPWGVVTDGPAVSQRAKCEALGLGGAAALIVTAELGTSKPDQRCFEEVELALGLSGPDLVYVADNPHKDFDGPLARGWRVLRVRRPESLHESADSPRGVGEVSSLEPVNDLGGASEQALAELLRELGRPNHR
ncbi:HAD family hydrolase [Nocardioides sp. HDW12B]|uniref:HAD family hydrolase n=1 Tax=Nocardioides sp. HDW12B TaxID=2714939 RepID=UPI00140C4C9D|nr:HAD family hydrolase [Nocardioides sp. HDW12B]QIK64969.1 HAD family hydrolase [Nocardioides sp. HDW12B]